MTFSKEIFSTTIFFIVTTTYISNAQDRGLAIMQKCVDTIKSKQSITYEATFRMKMFDMQDTLIKKGSIKLLRKAEDSIFNGYIWVINNKTHAIYDLEHIYQISETQKKGKRFFPHNGQEWAMSGDVSSNLIWKAFLHPQAFGKAVMAANKIQLVKESSLQHIPCWIIEVSYNDRGDYKKQKQILFISKTDYIPLKVESSVTFQGNTQFTDWRIRKYSFTTLNKEDFDYKKKFKGIGIEDYIEEQDEAKPFLDSGSKAPMLVGKIYGENFRTDTIYFEKKITVLDFWYSSCYPCIKSMPVLEKLWLNYSDKGVQMFAVNAYDNTRSGIQKLPRFLKYNKIEYPILLTKQKFILDYKISIWPTFYIIDQLGNVYVAHPGNTANLYEVLSNALNDLILLQGSNTK